MAQQSNQVMNGRPCGDCCPIKTARCDQKCKLCPGYYADDGMHDHVDVEDEGNDACHYCKNHDGLVQSKRTGIIVCGEGCDDMPRHDDGVAEWDDMPPSNENEPLNLNEKEEDSDMDME